MQSITNESQENSFNGEILMKAVQRLQVDVGNLLDLTNKQIGDQKLTQNDLLNIDKSLNKILDYINLIQNQDNSKINLDSQAEKLNNDLQSIKRYKSILTKALYEQKDMDSDEIKSYIISRNKLEHDIQAIKKDISHYQTNLQEMKQYLNKKKDYLTKSDLANLQKTLTSLQQINIKKYLQIAKSLQNSQNLPNLDFISDFSDQIKEQQSQLKHLEERLEKAPKSISQYQQIQKEILELEKIRDSILEITKSYLNDYPSYMMQLEADANNLENHFNEKIETQKNLFPKIRVQAQDLFNNCNIMIDEFQRQNKSASLMSEANFMKEIQNHKNILNEMNEKIDFLIEERKQIEHNINHNPPLSSTNLQRIIIGLDGMKSMTKFATHVSTRIKTLEEDQSVLMAQNNQLNQRIKLAENNIENVHKFASNSSTKKSRGIKNELQSLHNESKAKRNELLNNNDNMKDIYKSVYSKFSELNEIKKDFDKIQQENSKNINNAYDLNMRIENEAQSSIQSLRLEINSVPSLVEEKFNDLNTKMMDKVEEVRRNIQENNIMENPRDMVASLKKEIKQKIDLQSKNLLNKTKLDKYSNDLNDFKSSSTKQINTMKIQLKNIAKKSSQMDSEFADEIVLRVKKLDVFSDKMKNYSQNIKNSPFGELNGSAIELSRKLSSFVSGEPILDVDLVTSSNDLLTSSALEYKNESKIAYYAGVVHSHDPLIKDNEYVNMMNDFMRLKDYASRIVTMEQNARNVKNRQIDLLAKIDSKATNNQLVPLVAEKIKQCLSAVKKK